MNAFIKTIRLIGLLGFSITGLTEVNTTVQNQQLEMTGLNPEFTYQLKIQTPGGELKSINFSGNAGILVDAKDLDLKGFNDGQYKYELMPIVDFRLKTERDTDLTTEEPENQNLTSLSGTFSVKNGKSVVDQDEATRDQQINDDLIVLNSLCVGQDCVNGESFGFDTIRLKENNLRIRFQDTSVSASFPSNDWELTANDSNNGGANRFSITDIDGGRTPFTVEAGARNNALYIDNGGKIGFGTNNPVVETHVVDGDTPTLRLEQNGSNGWTPQTWDVAGNEANFFVRDVTNGSKLPFRIRPGAPSSSIDIQADGLEFLNNTVVFDNDNRFGFGTNDPKAELHVTKPTGNATIRLENLDTSSTWKFTNNSNVFEISQIGSGVPEFTVSNTGEMEIQSSVGAGATNLSMDSNGNMTIRGALSQNSDVNTKENITPIDTKIIFDKLMSLPVTIWNYEFDEDNNKHLGPMAQDFFHTFNLGNREDKISMIDTAGVTIAALQELGSRVVEKDKDIKKLKASNKELLERIEKLEQLLTK